MPGLKAETWVRGISNASAFLVSVAAIGGGTYLISQGRDASGLALIIADLVLLAGTFVVARVARSRQRDD